MNKQTTIWAAIALTLGLAGGHLLSGGEQMAINPAPQTAAADGPCAGGTEALMWRNPMNPAVTSPTFQQDSMGMDYLPVCPEDASGGGNMPAGTVKIDPSTAQNIGVRTTAAVRQDIANEITTVGRITFDETKLVTLHPKVEGWVDKLFVDKTGELVHDNTMLLSFYSPQLVATQEEYLLALKNWQQLKESPYPDVRDGARQLLDSALDRLNFFDVAQHQITELQQTHKVRKSMHIHAPAAGVVTKIGAREGAHVTPASELYQIADLSSVWVLADLYEYEIPWVREGDAATLTIASLPGRTFSGHITHIYPYLDPKTRTNKVRIEFDNRDGLLKPEMFGDVTIAASQRQPGIYVPRESVMMTGKQAHLFVQTGPGHFEPRTVKTGNRVAGRIEILEGVKAGERVVTSGQFLIDSESSIREAAAKMVVPKGNNAAAEAPAKAAPDMDMGDMEMGDHSSGTSNGMAAGHPQGERQEAPNHMHMNDHSTGTSNGTAAGRPQGEGQEAPSHMDMPMNMEQMPMESRP